MLYVFYLVDQSGASTKTIATLVDIFDNDVFATNNKITGLFEITNSTRVKTELEESPEHVYNGYGVSLSSGEGSLISPLEFKTLKSI